MNSPSPSTSAPAVNRSAKWPADEPFELALPPGTLVDALRRAVDQRGEKAAIHYYGRTLSYRELDEEVERLAQHLKNDQGVARGDRVLLMMQNSPQYIIGFHAVLRADAVVVSANPMYKTAELEHIVQETETRVVLAGEDVLDQVQPLVASAGVRVVLARYADFLPADCAYRLPPVLTAPRVTNGGVGVTPWPNGPLAKDRLHTQAGPDDLALLIYTSGTTGKPKACMHPHRTLLFTACAQIHLYKASADSVISAFQPLFHVAGMQHSMNTPLCAGAAIVLLTRWDRDVALSLIGKHQITYMNAPPTMVVDLLSREDVDADALRSLQVITGGGSAMPQAVVARLAALTGLTYIEAYGMTEAMSPTHINPLAAPKVRSGGIPIHETDCLIVDPDSLEVLGPNQTGEILLSGPQIFNGYWRRPDADATAFVTLNGRRYYRSGDLGHCDEDHYVFISDRIKRMINASGYKVWPAEVEAMLYEHPAILECAIISVPDDYRGEDVKALIVLREGWGEKVSEADITTWAREKMAVYKAPRHVEFRDSLPRSPSNKIDWRLLQEREWANRPTTARA